ncbi:hypothetical protein MMC28_001191 [Mycoblastus sanguinarius]|nr:hypothetical protein [Mycoblastus sanguinarius]
MLNSTEKPVTILSPSEGGGLSNLTDVNRKTLTQTDEEFQPHSWDELKEILRRYLAWSHEVKNTHGSVAKFVCQERLHWSAPSGTKTGFQNPSITGTRTSDLEPKNPTPFGHPDDYKILRNDWPYAVPAGVAHIVVWLKTPFAVTEPDGHLLPVGQAQIQAFVDEKFGKPMKDRYGVEDGENRVLWFKNWTALQSVGALEHFHCLLNGADEALLRQWTREGERVMM